MTEARKYNVLPLDSSVVERGDPTKRPNPLRGVTDFTYYPGMVRIPEANSPNVKNRSFRITANVEIPQSGAEGVLATQGGRFAGWAFLVLDGKPEFVYAYTNQDGNRYPHQRKDKTRIVGSEKLAPGAMNTTRRCHSVLPAHSRKFRFISVRVSSLPPRPVRSGGARRSSG